MYRQEVEQLTAAQRRGVGVRVFSGGAVGHAYTSDLSEGALDDVVQHAIDNAAVSDPDEFMALPQPQGEPADVDPYDPRLAEATDEQRIEIALEVEATALAADPRVKTVEDTMYVDGDGEVFIASTAGVRGSFRAGQCYAFAYVLAEQEGQVETGYSYSVGRAVEDLDPAFVGAEAAGRATRLLGAKKCPSMKAPVILDPFVSAAFFGVLSSALTADAVQKNRSLFAGREGQQVAGELLELVDDGTLPDGLDSAPFDGEGVPSGRTPLITGGVLQGFLYDTYTARKAGRASTGNGMRGGYSSLPGVRPSNLVVTGPATPLDDIVAGLEQGRAGHRRRRHPLGRQPHLGRVLRGHQRRPHRERQAHDAGARGHAGRRHRRHAHVDPRARRRRALGAGRQHLHAVRGHRRHGHRRHLIDRRSRVDRGCAAGTPAIESAGRGAPARAARAHRRTEGAL